MPQALVDKGPSLPLRATLLLGLAAVVAVGAFGGALSNLVSRWSMQEEYSRGYLILVIAAWLLWRRRDALAAAAGRPSWAGVALVAAAMLLNVVGQLSAIFIVAQVGFVLGLMGLALGVGGWRLLRVAFVPIAFLLFAIPLPYFIDFIVSMRLQLLSSELAGIFIRAFGIPVFIDGNVIDLGPYKLQVVDACSGLRYLFPLMSLGFIAAYLFQAPFWQRALIFLSTVPIMVLMNSLRIGLVGVLTNVRGRGAAEGTLHLLEGWVLFMVCAGLLMGEMWLLARWVHKKPLFDILRVPERTPAFSPPGTRQSRRLGPLAASLALHAGGGAIVSPLAAQDELTPERAHFVSFPCTVGEWRGRVSAFEPEMQQALSADDYLLADYAKRDGQAVNFHVAFYASQRKGGSPHSPLMCIPGGGWSIATVDRATYPDTAAPFPFNRAVIERGKDRQIEFRNALKHKKEPVPAWEGLARIEEGCQDWSALEPILGAIVEHRPGDRPARLKLGRLLLLGGALDRALTAIAPDSDGESSSADAVALKAAILWGLKDPEGSVGEAQRALGIEPDNLDAVLVLAREKLSGADSTGALDALGKGRVRPDSEAVVHLVRIEIFERLGDDARLEDELRKLIRLQPRAVGSRRQGQEPEAEAELRAAAAADPADVAAFLEVVRFPSARKGLDAARRETEARIEAGGDVFPYKLALAELQLAHGELPQATETLLKLVAETGAADRKVKAQLLLADIHVRRKDIATAEPVIAAVLDADALNTEALRLRAIAWTDRGLLENAIADLRQALNDKPQSAEPLQLLAAVLERTGAIELAEKHYADATRAADFHPSVVLQYAAFLQRRRRPEHAEDVLTELAAPNGNDVQVWTALARAKLLRGDWDGAQQVAETIRQLGDRKGLAHKNRGAAFGGQRKLDDSIQALRTAFQSAPNPSRPMVALVRPTSAAGRPAKPKASWAAS